MTIIIVALAGMIVGMVLTAFILTLGVAIGRTADDTQHETQARHRDLFVENMDDVPVYYIEAGRD